jgi:CheY-like chemotaxis protein
MLNRTKIDDGDTLPAPETPRSVMIVEDDGLLALMLEDLLREAGAADVFMCREVSAALRVAEAERLDCAVLDVSAHGGSTYAVADALAARDIPFLFCTGLRAEDIDIRHRHRPLLGKPYSDEAFKACLAATLSR